MSTEKINVKLNNIHNKSQRFAEIAKLGEVIFHTKDLANLWQIKNTNTLHTTLKRYTKAGLLFRIYKGFYSIKPIDNLDPLLLGSKALHEFCYITTETVLQNEGIILQSSNKITFVSSKSKKFSIGKHNYYSRKLVDKYLYNPIGVHFVNGIKIATLSRAIADMLYFNSNAYFDAEKFINWKEVKKIQEAVGYPLILKCYDFTKSKRRKA
ncbi:hypothetical protein KKC67_02055 [Patescibacteria group bacterium]|nr:hypothetical protein [Patescibacteria group bacterium]MBU0879815.1 hypothetical protein [Patescibacteria group bacterium]MBU0880230.1 hypothetical protein [Patescibacteria group bacterium]MBU0897621.1 hypothetical protein [Patescibacteria group bacterium]MBU1062551.1 hypothetical protein [Patescibacteria group bacterium]